MKMKYFAALAAGAATVASCGGADEAAQTNQSATAGQVGATASAGEQSGEVHSGSGDITEVSSDRVSISHGPVESIGWPAMTMSFQAESPGMLKGLNVGDPVAFQFRQADGQSVLTSIKREQQ